MVRDGDVERRRHVRRLGLHHLHQGLQAVERKGVRVVDVGVDLLHTAIAADNERAAIDLLHERLRGFLNVSDEFFQHDLCTSYAVLMIFNWTGRSCSAPSNPICPGI